MRSCFAALFAACSLCLPAQAAFKARPLAAGFSPAPMSICKTLLDVVAPHSTQELGVGNRLDLFAASLPPQTLASLRGLERLDLSNDNDRRLAEVLTSQLPPDFQTRLQTALSSPQPNVVEISSLAAELKRAQESGAAQLRSGVTEETRRALAAFRDGQASAAELTEAARQLSKSDFLGQSIAAETAVVSAVAQAARSEGTMVKAREMASRLLSEATTDGLAAASSGILGTESAPHAMGLSKFDPNRPARQVPAHQVPAPVAPASSLSVAPQAATPLSESFPASVLALVRGIGVAVGSSLVETAQDGSRLAALAVDPAQVELGFTRNRTIDPATLAQEAPGTVIVDIGRHAAIVPGDRGTAVIDHHQLPRGHSATERVAAMAGELAEAGTILQIRTHADPDFDAISSVMLVNAIRQNGSLPSGLQGFVDYVNDWDSGALNFAGPGGLESLRQSLGVLVMGLAKVADDSAMTQVLAKFGRKNFGEVFAADFAAQKGAFFGELEQEVGRQRVALTSAFLSRLLETYDFGERRGAVALEDVPDVLVPVSGRKRELREIFQAASDKMNRDMELFTREMGQATTKPVTVRLRSEIEGQETAEISMKLAVNPESAFFDYLYAQGDMGGIIYKNNLEQLNGNTNRDYQPEARVNGSKVVVAVSDQAGATVGGLDAYLDGIERDARRRIGLSDQPKKEAWFWKQGVPGRLVLTTEGTVLSRDDLVAALKAYGD